MEFCVFTARSLKENFYQNPVLQVLQYTYVKILEYAAVTLMESRI